MFTPERHVVPSAPPCDRYWISCDYGTVNPSSFGLWGHCDGTWYRLEEYYYDARAEGERRTDEEHYAALWWWTLPQQALSLAFTATGNFGCFRQTMT